MLKFIGTQKFFLNIIEKILMKNSVLHFQVILQKN